MKKENTKKQASSRFYVKNITDSYKQLIIAVETEDRKCGDISDAWNRIVYTYDPDHKTKKVYDGWGKFVQEEGSLKPSGKYDVGGEIMVQDGYGKEMGYKGICAAVAVEKPIYGTMTVSSVNGVIPKKPYTRAIDITDADAAVAYVQDCAIAQASNMAAEIPLDDKLMNLSSFAFMFQQPTLGLNDEQLHEFVDNTFFSTPRVEYTPPNGYTVLHAVKDFTDPSIDMYGKLNGISGVPASRRADEYFLCEDCLVDFYVKNGLAEIAAGYTRWCLDTGYVSKIYDSKQSKTSLDKLIEYIAGSSHQ